MLIASLTPPSNQHLEKSGLRFSITALMASLAAGPCNKAPKCLSSSVITGASCVWAIFISDLVTRNEAAGLAASLAACDCA